MVRDLGQINLAIRYKRSNRLVHGGGTPTLDISVNTKTPQLMDDFYEQLSGLQFHDEKMEKLNKLL